MFTQKINIIWIVNLVLFVSVVFLGITQTGKGADISSFEDSLESASITKMELSEKIFKTGNEKSLSSNAIDLGFAKPSKVLYFNSLDTVASIK